MPAVDDNGKSVIYGVSHRDGRTPVPIKFRSDGRMLTDSSTTIEFDPEITIDTTDNGRPIALATSSDDDTTIKPWVVNEDTGAVLVDM